MQKKTIFFNNLSETRQRKCIKSDSSAPNLLVNKYVFIRIRSASLLVIKNFVRIRSDG